MSGNLKLRYLFLGFFVCTLPVLVYFLNFGTTKDYKLIYELSHDMTIWGQFGDFIGGTTGTLISAAAFAAVYFTLQQQRESIRKQEEELAEMKRQSQISRLENILNQTTIDLESQLKQRHSFTHVDPFTGLPIEFDCTLQDHLAGLSTLDGRDLNSLYIFPMPFLELQKTFAIITLTEELRSQIAEFIMTAETICHLLLAINELSIDDVATKYYKYKYLLVFTVLHDCNLNTETLNKCFDFKKLNDIINSNTPISEVLKIL